MRLRSRAGIAAGLLAVAVGVAWAAYVRPLAIAGEQLRNAPNLRIYFNMVEDYRKAHGVLPETLSQAVPETFAQRSLWLACRDAYGHTIYYEARSDQFLIASYGRDGIRDRQPYAHEGDDRAAMSRPCRDADTDTAFSSDGVFQACTK